MHSPAPAPGHVGGGGGSDGEDGGAGGGGGGSDVAQREKGH